MKIKVVCVGAIKESFFKDAVNEYIKRLQKYCKLEIVELKQSKYDTEFAKQDEYEDINSHLEGYVITLAIEGQELSSKDLATKINDIAVKGYSTITFVIGGSFGVDDRIKNKSQMLLSFSKLTFPHQLFRIILLEQIYRAYNIQNNTPYHK